MLRRRRLRCSSWRRLRRRGWCNVILVPARELFFLFLLPSRSTPCSSSNAVLLSLSTPVRPTDCKLESDGLRGKTERHTTRLIDTSRRTRRNSVRTPSHLAQNAVQRIRAKQHCILQCARRAYDATPAQAASAAIQYAQRNPPRARALRIASRSTCACVAQLCAALRHASLDRGRARVGRKLQPPHKRRRRGC